MITDGEIRANLTAYLMRQISLNEFEDWLVQRSWNMHQDSDQAAQDLVSAIELRLSEYSSDHLSDAGLERELVGLVSPAMITLTIGTQGQPTWTARGTSELLERKLSVLSA